ncbi:MAG: hypothetical protein IKE36_03935 [Solobacterium sp.]|nr:hypothetical protein [Solobacterium sp.]
MSARKLLKTISWIYIVIGVLTVVTAIPTMMSVKDTVAYLEASTPGITFAGYDPRLILEISVGLEFLVYLWISSMIRKVADGRSKGTFLIILTSVSLFGSAIGLMGGFSLSSLVSLGMDVLLLFLLYKVRSENRNIYE